LLAVREGLKGIKTVAAILAVSVLYFGASKFGLALAFTAKQVSAVWPPTGLALAAVLLCGFRIWPAIFLGAFLANVTTYEPIATACGIAIGNTLEAVVGAWMLRALANFDTSLRHLKDVRNLLLFAALFATMISATIGVTSLCLGGVHHWTSYRSMWLLWWIGDATGAILVAPLLLVWRHGPRVTRPIHALAEAAILLAGVGATCLIVFGDLTVMGVKTHNFLYLVFIFIIWAAIRFGQHGTTLVTLVASSTAIWAATHHAAPFDTIAVDQNLATLQIFMAVVAMTGLFLSAAIAERKELERAKTLLASIVESSGDAIISEDLNGVINSWNEGATRLFGYSATEALGQPVTLIDPSGLEEEKNRLLARLLQGERVSQYETARLTKDGRRLDVSITLSPLYNEKGAIVGASKMVRDITQRKHAERALQESDRNKEEFLPTLAHELRNPLASISGALHLIQLPTVEAAQRAKAYAIMERQLQQIIRLVEDLVDVSRISRGKIELRKERIALIEAVNIAAETVKPLMEANRHVFSIDLAKEAFWLDADLTRLSQIFINLLNNAANYTPAGGHIGLSATAEGDAVAVRVRDNGIGIPASMLPKVFDMFEQATHPAERSQKGLGIGLTLVKKLVEMHGGNVEVHSEGKGKGSEFMVRLPLAAPPQATRPSEAKPSLTRAPRRFRILLADDNESFAETFGQMLDILGHEVKVAHDGISALALAQSFMPDVVLLDIGLPGMNGYEVCKKIRALPALRHTVLIAQTGFSHPQHRERASAAGFDHHLIKPVKFAFIEELLKSLDIDPAAPPSFQKSA
jgi:PAS domain S-box-containing protein